MGSALKKTAHAAEQERPDVAARRLAWLESQPDLDADWCSSMRPALDQDGPSAGPLEAWPTLPCRGPTWTLEDNYLHRRSTPGWPDRADAPGRADEWGRLPCLCRAGPRSHPGTDQVIMDNLPAHKVSGVKQAIEAAGATRPPAALFARLQSHRTSLRQTQGPAQKGRRSNMTYGMPTPRSSNSSHQPNAPTSSLTQDMNQNDRKMLYWPGAVAFTRAAMLPYGWRFSCMS